MDNGLFGAIYNPDVLSCLANLSNDEVFTPPEVVNQMLDMLPQELFSNPDTTFLDPACKTGVFLREIAKRLIKGLAPQIPNLQERIDHIFRKQLYGIAITELTSLLSRRGLYCSKYPNSEFSVTKFDDKHAQGNIRFKRIEHGWQKGKCVFCGASESEYERGDELETHAYEWIHTMKPERIFDMKFDVIIGNPPYQLSDGGNESSAKPIYNLFIEQAKKLNPHYISMIVPSRWMQGGKGLDKFREDMIADTHISHIKDYEDSQKCFSGVHIDGGVCYFLWDRTYSGPCCYEYETNNEIVKSVRFLNNKYSNAVIRDDRQITIIDKICSKGENKFSEIVSSRKPYGIAKDLFNSPERYPKACLSDTTFNGALLIHGVKGHKGGARRLSQYIRSELVKDDGSINKYKLFFTTSYTAGATNPPEPIVAGPGVVCTETFLRIGPFETEAEMNNCFGYIHTNFFKALLKFRRGSMQVTKTVFEYIPAQDFTKPWTDDTLYKKYNLNDDEISFIETLINSNAAGGNEQ